jgi:Leucine-rich repeat (LRR) protein
MGWVAGTGRQGLNNLRVLSLSSNSFKGGLPSNIATIPNLQVLNLYDNAFEGNIPTLNNMHILRELYLGDNDFRGGVPELPRSVEIVMLDGNKLESGFRSQAFENADSLRILNLRSNMIRGTVPDGISALQSLETFDIAKVRCVGVGVG